MLAKNNNSKVMKRIFPFFLAGWVLASLCFLPLSHLQAQQKKKLAVAIVGFYNQENLFDTINDPKIDDEEFLPNSPNHWNTEKYMHKLANMSKVISKIGTDINPDGFALLGVSEVENLGVMKDLAAQPLLKNRHLGIVHYDSPDRRGIDVGLFYNPKYFKLIASKSYRLHVPDKPYFRTRDQLLVSGLLLGDTVYVIVNHWPSRYGGEKRSRPLRNAAADLTRHISDSLLRLNPEAKIIVMGDLNDNPTNESVMKHMRAVPKNKMKPGDFYNPMYKLYKEGIGSTAWRDTWSLFDQVFVSPGLLGPVTLHSGLKFYKAFIFNKPFMQQKDGRYKGYPYRTFAGGTWMGGYSDHFPAYIVLVKQVQ